MLYRSTGVILANLVHVEDVQLSLFDDVARIEKLSKLYGAIDTLSKMFGKHTVEHVASHPVKLQRQHEGERGDTPNRKSDLFKGENKRQRLGVPMLDIKV